MDQKKLKVRRSFIFTPGLKPDMFPKAIESGADMVCIELEDGIAIKDKDEARKNTIDALKTLEVKSDVELVVRVNCQRTQFGLLDLESFISSKINIRAIMLPKVKTPDEITFIDDLLTESLEIKNQVKANNGTVSLPTGPGLGVTPKRDFLDSFRICD